MAVPVAGSALLAAAVDGPSAPALKNSVFELTVSGNRGRFGVVSFRASAPFQRLDRPGRQAGLSSFLALPFAKRAESIARQTGVTLHAARGEAAVIWRVGEDGESGRRSRPGRPALMGKARPATACQNLRAFDGHRIAKGSPLAAGSMGVAHATRICAIVHNSGQARWRPLFGSSIYPC
jgi:hypothetical protein